MRWWIVSKSGYAPTVIATHDATDAFATGAEVALLREGRLAAFGSAEDVLKEERERIVHRLGPQQLDTR